MSGEIHNNLPRRRKLSWKDDRSTNKYYASSETSALAGQNVASDSTLKSGELPKPNVKGARMHRDERSADKKYYGNAAPQAPTAQQIAKGLGKLPRQLGEGIATEAQAAPQKRKQLQHSPDASLTVTAPHQVNGVMQGVIAALQAGQKPVVYVEAGNTNLLRRTRAALEMLVTREQISEDQYHDVRLSYTPTGSDKKAIDEAFKGTPQPSGEKKVEKVEAALPADPLAFLQGEGEDPDDPVVDTTPMQLQEVDASKDEVSSVINYPEAPPAAKEEEDDNDFLKPRVVKEVPTPTTVELDRAIDTDKPVRVVDREDAMSGIGEVPDSPAPGNDIVATESMEGIGSDTPPRRKAGRRSGRGT